MEIRVPIQKEKKKLYRARSNGLFFFSFIYFVYIQGVLVQQNTKNGIIANHKALILQKVKRHMAGNYTCIASSVEGDGKSNTVQLRVMCKSFSLRIPIFVVCVFSICV